MEEKFLEAKRRESNIVVDYHNPRSFVLLRLLLLIIFREHPQVDEGYLKGESLGAENGRETAEKGFSGVRSIDLINTPLSLTLFHSGSMGYNSE